LKKGYTALILMVFALGMLSLASAAPQQNAKVLVWSANGAYHVEVTLFAGNATAWGYDVESSTDPLNASMLEGVSVLIVNAPDYVNGTAEVGIITTWFEAEAGRAIWVTADSDYGGYWYPWGTPTTPFGVNHVIEDIGGHVFIQDDAVSDADMNDGASYRVVASVPNAAEAPLLMAGIENISMHGPTAVIPYSSVTDGVGTVADWSNLATATWIMNSSDTAQIQDQDFDDEPKWEGYPVAVNMSLTMVGIEWDIGENNNKLVVAGESFFADYKLMFGTETRYRNNTALQNIELTHNLLDWSTGKLALAGAAPGFEILTVLIALVAVPAVFRRFRK
jgi:hypothetical protein